MRKIFQKRIYREDLRANPTAIYLFGDNMQRSGLGGQAREMRGEPNAIGIVTKMRPTMEDRAFFTDEHFDALSRLINCDLAEIYRREPDIVVIPLDGIGTGLAQLDTRAPKLFAYLQKRLRGL